MFHQSTTYFGMNSKIKEEIKDRTSGIEGSDSSTSSNPTLRVCARREPLSNFTYLGSPEFCITLFQTLSNLENEEQLSNKFPIVYDAARFLKGKVCMVVVVKI